MLTFTATFWKFDAKTQTISAPATMYLRVENNSRQAKVDRVANILRMAESPRAAYFAHLTDKGLWVELKMIGSANVEPEVKGLTMLSGPPTESTTSIRFVSADHIFRYGDAN